MARKKEGESHRLMAVAEKILKEKIYRFPFPAAHRRTGVGRSTIYDYFPGKDEWAIVFHSS